MTRRTERVNELLREELSALLVRGVKDPRVGQGLVTITEVVTAPDLKHATVYVSHLGETPDRAGVLLGLSHAAHYLQRELARRLDLRTIPELSFRFDPSIERGDRLAQLISQVSAGQRGDAGGQAS